MFYVTVFLGGKLHILGHCAEGRLTESVHVVHGAHPVLPTPTVSTFPTGDDLLRHGLVADLETVFFRGCLAEIDDFAYEFVPGYDRGLAVAFAVLVTPEERGTEVALEVACADADGFNSNEDFARSCVGTGCSSSR